jgi:hypothetical protein
MPSAFFSLFFNHELYLFLQSNRRGKSPTCIKEKKSAVTNKQKEKGGERKNRSLSYKKEQKFGRLQKASYP